MYDAFEKAGVVCDVEVRGVGVPDGCGGCAPEVSVDAFEKAGVVCDVEVVGVGVLDGCPQVCRGYHSYEL